MKVVSTAYPVVETNGSTLVEEVFLNHAIKDVSKREKRYVYIIHSHLRILNFG